MTALQPMIIAASQGSLSHWEETPRSMVALVVLLHQFPALYDRTTAQRFQFAPIVRQIIERAHRSDVCGRTFGCQSDWHADD
jgi:uncharacterized protein (DUF924 family)